MNKTRLFSTSLAALLLTTSFSTTAFAYSPDDTSDIVIKDSNVDETTSVNVYKILNVNWDNDNDQPVNPQYTWASEIADWVSKNFPDYIGDDNSVTDAFEESLSDAGEVANHQPVSNGAAEFYDKLSLAIKSGEANLTALKTVKATGTDITVPDMGVGGYLALFTGNNDVYRPSVAIVKPVYDEATGTWKLAETTDIIVKKTPVSESVTKEVDTNVVGINEVQNFTVSSAVPVYPVNASNKTFLMADDLPDQLTLNPDSVTVKGAKEDGSTVDLVEGEHYTRVTSDKNGKTVDLGLDFDYQKIFDISKVTVTYSTTVNEKAVPGQSMDNKFYANFANDPYSETGFIETPNKIAKSWTYGVDLDKIDGTSKTGLPGAEFSISGGEGKLQFIKVADGHYRVAKTSEEGSTDQVVVDANGNLKIDGLDTGDYSLVEEIAPKGGYIKLENPIEFTIADANEDGIVDENAGDNGYISLTVSNTKGFDLPKTGAQGVAAMAAGGALLLTVGGTLIAMRRRESEDTKA